MCTVTYQHIICTYTDSAQESFANLSRATMDRESWITSPLCYSSDLEQSYKITKPTRDREKDKHESNYNAFKHGMSSIDDFSLWVQGSTTQSQGPRRRTMLSTSIHETGRGWSSTVGIRQHFQQSCLGCGLFLGYAKVHCKGYVLLVESPRRRCTAMGLPSNSHDRFL
jgi:hypothetical protein